jgi:hypothetical protein
MPEIHSVTGCRTFIRRLAQQKLNSRTTEAATTSHEEIRRV